MQNYFKGEIFFRICTIFALFVLIVAVPASAIAPPTIDSITPSTTNVVNGGTVIFTVSGTCSVSVSQAWISYNTPQTGWTTGFNVVTNGNQWTGQYSMNIPSNAQSGQYSVTGIQVEDSAGNHVSKNFNVVVTASNSATASPPTIDSVTPSTTNVVNGGTIIFTVSGTCSVPVSQAWISYNTPQTGWTTGFNVVTNGNQWTGQYSMNIPSNAQSGQYSVTGIQVEDSAGNHVSKNFNVVVTAVNSDQYTPTSPTTQTTSPTTVLITTSPIMSITTVPITALTTTSPTTLVTTGTSMPTSSPTQTVTLKKFTPWPTDTPPHPSPVGVEIGIIATIGAALLVIKRK